MKNYAVLSATLGVCLLLAGCGNGTVAGTSTGTSTGTNSSSVGTTVANAQVVDVQSTNWKWTLSKTTLAAGKPIEFDVTGMEGVHGFSIDGTSITQQIIQGKTTKITWTPPKAGTYIIRCNIYCGAGHEGMTTTFTVA